MNGHLELASDCRRKARLSPNSATVAVVSPFSATVALFCNSVDMALRHMPHGCGLEKSVLEVKIFSARQHICYSALYAIARPSVCPSVTPVDQSKTVEVRIMQPSPQSSPMTSFLTLNFTVKFQREDRERGRRIREGYEKYAIFSQ